MIAKGRRVKRPREQKEVAFGLADLSTHEELVERIVLKGGVKSFLTLLSKSSDPEAQRFAALGLANCASAQFNRAPIVQVKGGECAGRQHVQVVANFCVFCFLFSVLPLACSKGASSRC